MGQYLSEDLRIRVIQAIEGGLSRNAAGIVDLVGSKHSTPS